MIAARTKKRLSRLGVIALFCGLPMVLLGQIASNIAEALRLSDETHRALVGISTIVARLEKHRGDLSKPVDTASLYLASVSDSRARAELQTLTTKLAAQAGGQLSEVQTTTTPKDEADRAVVVQLSLVSDAKGLLDLLYALESGMPLMEITSLNVQRTDAQRGYQSPEGSALRVDITVRAHWRKSIG